MSDLLGKIVDSTDCKINLGEIVSESLNKMQFEGKIESMVEKHLSEMMNGIIRDAFSYGSDLKKHLEEVVKSKIRINLDELTIPAYNKQLLVLIEKQLNGHLHVQGMERFEADLKRTLDQEIPESVKISELMEELAKGDEFVDETCTEISFHEHNFDRSGGYHLFYFDEEPRKDKYSCKYSIGITGEGIIYTGKIDGCEIKKSLFIGGLHGFEAKLFKMYAAGTKIIPDVDNVKTEYWDD